VNLCVLRCQLYQCCRAVPILRPDADTDLEEGEEGFEGEAVLDAAAAAAAWGPSVCWEEEGQEEGYGAAAGEEDSGVEDGAAAGLSWEEELAGVDGMELASGELTAAELAQADSLPAAAAAKPASWAAAVATEAAGGSSAARPASRAASRAAVSRARAGAASPAAAAAAAEAELLLLSADEGQQQKQSAVMTPDMLKELLVEELVHDVEELVEHMGPQVRESWSNLVQILVKRGWGHRGRELGRAGSRSVGFGAGVVRFC
jgi:hypothetical protein